MNDEFLEFEPLLEESVIQTVGVLMNVWMSLSWLGTFQEMRHELFM